MTNWLKWRLCALLGTSLLAGATYLHAQNNYPAPPKTPEEAGTLFFQLLSSGGYRSSSYYGSQSYMQRADGAINSISRQQVQSFSTNGYRNYRVEELLALLAQEMNEPQYEGRVSSTEGPQTIVEVSPSTSKNRQVVVIAEDGGYRVDLKATFAKWNNFSGEKLEEQWYRYTGVTSPALLQNGNFLKSQCQSNLKQQMLGIFQYAQDYDEKLPPAREWVDVVMPYVKSEQVYQCPALSKGGNGYAYNQYLSRVAQYRIADAAKTINIYETSNPKRNWFGPGSGRAYRHQDGWNLAFADGHVKWFKKGQPADVPFKPTLSRNSSQQGWGATPAIGAP